MKSFVLLSVKVLARKLTTINKQNHPNAGSLWSSFGSHRRKDMAVWILAPQRVQWLRGKKVINCSVPGNGGKHVCACTEVWSLFPQTGA